MTRSGSFAGALDRLSRGLARVPRTEVSILGGRVAAYKATVYAGALCGLGAIFALAASSGRSLSVTAILVVGCVGGSLFFARLTRVVLGFERFTFFHYLILCLGVGAGLLAALREPVLVHLDVLALGLGATHCVGRWGCAFAGCCHGRPAGWGIRYDVRHTAIGFPAHLVGVSLFPVQLAESAWILGQLAVATAAWSLGASPGTALTSYVAGYAAGRLVLELFRGDTGRRHALGMSEAQWTSAALLAASVGLGALRLLPVVPWVLGEASLAGALVILLLTRRGGRTFWLPTHVEEIGVLVDALARASGTAPADATPAIGRTRHGLIVSASHVRHGDDVRECFGLSLRDGALSERAGARLVGLVAALRGATGPTVVARGDDGLLLLELPRRTAHAL